VTDGSVTADAGALREVTAGTGTGLDAADIVLNIGPQHPSTHGVLRLRLALDGDRIVRAQPIVGYMHRGAEKLFEVRDYRQIIVLANRHDWLSAFANELGVVLASRCATIARSSCSRTGTTGCPRSRTSWGSCWPSSA
jgi:NADH-quinone oxidoreductase subunit D